MSSDTKLKVFKKSGLFVAIMLCSMLLFTIVHAGSAPDFTFTDIDGNTHQLSSFQGSVVILDFFGIACSACQAEMGQLKTVANTFGSNVVIISIDVWGDSNDQLTQFRNNNEIPWIVSGDTAQVWGRLYGGTTVPLLCVIDQTGNLIYQHVGGADASVLTGEIQGLLGTGSSLTVNTSPSLSGVHFRVDGLDYYTTGGSFTIQLSAGQHQVQLVDTMVTESADTQSRFSRWSGIGSGSSNPIQIGVSGSSTLEADFDTYYQTVFVQTGSQGTPQATIDGASYVLPQTFWFQAGSSHSFSYGTIGGGTGIQYVAASTSCTSPITVSSPSTITGNYKTQYYVTVVSEHGQPTLSQWVDQGSTLTTAVTNTADDNGAGTRYRCTGCEINAGILQSGTAYTFANVQAPEQICFQWTTQYRLALSAGPNCLILQPPNSPSDSWYDAGSSATYEAQAVNDCRLICWTLDGTSMVNTQLAITMDKPHTATVGLLPP